MSDLNDRLIPQFRDLAAAHGPQWDARMLKAQQQVTVDFARRGMTGSGGHASAKVDAAKAEMIARIADIRSESATLPALSEFTPIIPEDLKEAFRTVATFHSRIPPSLYRDQMLAMGMQKFAGDPTPQAQAEVDGQISISLGRIGALANDHVDKMEKREIELRNAIAANSQATSQGESVEVQKWGIWATVGSNVLSAIVGALIGYWIGKH